MKEETSDVKPAKETVFPEDGPIKSAAFSRSSNTLYVTYSSGEKKTYSPQTCQNNILKYMDADMDDVEVQERIRQEVQARIDEEYDGEGPRDIANYVIVRPYQISRKDLVQTMDEYLDKAKNMLRNVALDIDGKDQINEVDANRFFYGLEDGLMTQRLKQINVGKRCVVLEDEDGGKSYFYTNGDTVGERDLWYKAIPPLSELGSPA